MIISNVKIGKTINSPINGEGIVTLKTKRTITVTFKNGNVVKNTYKYIDSYFNECDF